MDVKIPLATGTPTKDEHMTINHNSNVKGSRAWTDLSIRATSALWLKPQFVICEEKTNPKMRFYSENGNTKYTQKFQRVKFTKFE